MRYALASALVMILLFSSCEITVKNDSGSGSGGSKIRNGIEVQARGVNLEQAFLLKEDGSLLPDDNKTGVNEKVILRLIADGWSEKDGKVFLDAGEKMMTSDGDVFLDEKDLFSAYTDGLEAKDAKYITLSVVITKIDKLYDHYKVLFEVKDKNDPSRSIEGSYKLYLK